MHKTHYRTLIVGAGSAGAVLAARLSECEHDDVLLLEAGPDYPTPQQVPSDLANGTENSMRAHDWGYKHRPSSLPLPFQYPRGKVVGGSSAVNTCIALRGQPGDYDEWAQLGLPQWRWSECLPYFKKLETDLDRDDEWHGRSGPLTVRRHTPEELAPWQSAFLEGCARKGFDACSDTNTPGAEGAGPHTMNKIDGRRISAAEAWLTPTVRRRPNLTILPDSPVRRVYLDRGQARGVEVGRSNTRFTADRVILCAGAINTPGILLRSGIGSESDLARLGITPTLVAPGVCRQLLDHPGSALFFRPKRGMADLSFPLIQTVLRLSSARCTVPVDVQIQPGSFFSYPGRRIPLFSIMMPLGKPKGVGSLTFVSSDPRVKPRITIDGFRHEEDRATALETLRLAAEIADTAPMRALATPLWPSRKVLRSAKADRWIRRACDSGYHPCGTVPMGPEGDPFAPCTTWGQLRGCDNLYVVDASLMPTIPTANTHLTVLMMAEKIADHLSLAS